MAIQRPRTLAIPTLLFVGVSTRGSFINRLFPVWAEAMKLGPVALEGIDLPPGAPAEAVRDAVKYILEAPLARGALVTTHKIAVYEHARDLFSALDDNAQRLGEISCIAKSPAGLVGTAKDPITAGLGLDALVSAEHWRNHPEACGLLLGCGGANVALAANLLGRATDERPQSIIMCDVHAERLSKAREHLAAFGAASYVDFRPTGSADENDRLLAALPPGSLVVNGTGLGKDRPGSPLTDAAQFPQRGLVWEFNYRGSLEFLRQAEAQAVARQLTVADGWRYFLFGWSHVIAEIFEVALDDTLAARLEAVAEDLRTAS